MQGGLLVHDLDLKTSQSDAHILRLSRPLKNDLEFRGRSKQLRPGQCGLLVSSVGRRHPYLVCGAAPLIPLACHNLPPQYVNGA